MRTWDWQAGEERAAHESPGLTEGPSQGSADSVEELSALVSQGNTRGGRGLGVTGLPFRGGVCSTVIRKSSGLLGLRQRPLKGLVSAVGDPELELCSTSA